MQLPLLKAPFPYFGGKSRVAPLVWQRFGHDVRNYVEPFAGSLAVLLGRSGGAGRFETVNDLDCYIANFWRALEHDADGVAYWADSPVNEADLHARHRWLIGQHDFRERMLTDPVFFDTRIAGWWVWGMSLWIGGWCEKLYRSRPRLFWSQGIQAQRALELRDYLGTLAARLRRVRVCCGNWTRVLTPTVTTRIGLTGVFLDPPYSVDAMGTEELYAHHSHDVSADVRAWAIEHGDDPLMRIALCGYEGEHRFPKQWTCVAWKAHGGYANQRTKAANVNRDRERIWFSPHCLKPHAARSKAA